ncbi:MAG: Trx7/PDZ domain-containing (seleno)protein [Phycisphaerae bacterium]
MKNRLTLVASLGLSVVVGVVVSLRADEATPPKNGGRSQAAEAVRVAINDLNVLGTDFWVYNDLGAAKAKAAKEDKPIFVTFRCVPCKACAGFDAEVAKGSDAVQKVARERFVSLRQVEMKGVDLTQFQFDYDLNWAGMFINADGTVYARYGTQSAEGPDAYNSTASLLKTMERVLELHKNYEKVKASLAAKRGAEKPWRTGLEMPGMENKEKLAGVTARNNCIHCHMINDAQHRQWQAEGTMSADRMNRYPLPENVGLHIVRDDGRKVEKAEGAAAKAGILAGDEITHAAGQPVTSIADLQWVLHNLPAGDSTVDLTVSRGGQSLTKPVALTGDWRKTDWKWRGSRWSVRPEPGFWAPVLNDKEIVALGDKVPAGTKPLRVQFMNQNKPQGKATAGAGVKLGDVIVAVDGKPLTGTPQDFQMMIRFERKVGDKLALKLLRNGKEVEVSVPLLGE